MSLISWVKKTIDEASSVDHSPSGGASPDNSKSGKGKGSSKKNNNSNSTNSGNKAGNNKTNNMADPPPVETTTNTSVVIQPAPTLTAPITDIATQNKNAFTQRMLDLADQKYVWGPRDRPEVTLPRASDTLAVLNSLRANASATPAEDQQRSIFGADPVADVWRQAGNRLKSALDDWYDQLGPVQVGFEANPQLVSQLQNNWQGTVDDLSSQVQAVADNEYWHTATGGILAYRHRRDIGEL